MGSPPTAFQGAVMLIHVIGVAIFFASAFILKTKLALLTWLAVCFAFMLQWLLFHACLLSYLEDPRGNGDSPILASLARAAGLSKDAMERLWIVGIIILPSVFVFTKLYKLI